MNDRKRFDEGMKMRREVLGNAYVDRAQAHENDFNADFQDLITRYAWGEVWTRPGLNKKARSLITIAMLVALNRSEELRLHLRAAANNGVSREEIQEVLLHSAIYCGVPAANTAFHIASEIFSQPKT
jgi:4-carboxymuconolactone decarboxylase